MYLSILLFLHFFFQRGYFSYQLVLFRNTRHCKIGEIKSRWVDRSNMLFSVLWGWFGGFCTKILCACTSFPYLSVLFTFSTKCSQAIGSVLNCIFSVFSTIDSLANGPILNLMNLTNCIDEFFISPPTEITQWNNFIVV